MGQQFVALLEQFGRGDDGGVSRCVVIMEKHFFRRQTGPFFLQFSVESAQ